VSRIYNLFKDQGEIIKHDHIAFRSIDDPRVNIDVLAKPFIDNGYEAKKDYHFERKKLYALHFEHKTDSDAPKVFISHLLTSHFSDYLQKIIADSIDKIPEKFLLPENLIFAGNMWGTPSYEIYEKLLEESEYAAWMYVYGFRVNHFAIKVNELKKLDTLEKINQFLKDNGYTINDRGGEIKGSKEKLLEQSSIMADPIDVEFNEGTHRIPACYYEFTKRYRNNQDQLYTGFIASSADKIFESTYVNDKGI
jgi:hypothetical protein